MRRLEGRVAMVTGGANGIGLGCALRLAQEGADVAESYRLASSASQRMSRGGGGGVSGQRGRAVHYRTDDRDQRGKVVGVSDAARRILVTGATGRQGGAVARQLLQAGFQLRALTRDVAGAAARALADAGVEVVPGDFDDAASLRAALQGVSGLFAMQTPYEFGTEQETLHGIRLADAAAQAGVAQIVYSSVASADMPTDVAHFESKGEIERHIATLGFAQATILRPVFFLEMLLSPGNLRALARGQVEMIFKPETRVAMIAVDDIAAMARAAFLNPEEWSGAAITLAGDEPNFVEVAAAFGAALGRPVAYRQVMPAQLDPESRPKHGTQLWLEAAGWKVDLPALRASYPFTARTIGQWAKENVAALSGTFPR